jgi:hypothetical protein
MGNANAKALGFEVGANMDAPLTKGDFKNWMEHKASAKSWGLPGWVAGFFGTVIFLMIVPIFAFSIILYMR